MKQERILMAHGSGGLMSQRLIEEIFKSAWDNEIMAPMLDGVYLKYLPDDWPCLPILSLLHPCFFAGGHR
jgi:hydrogenase expression/formation protein HypE